ncbi:MBG domain-containing protein [uncultured Mucilaginibacter sp.]|uniref:MBG domain-containing protein n=1 Tax=uncultured Mucilaginibacter sp. TaxID=797541 RepID=UPI00263987BF|nr:MBG domain-containing protein [uncultured Mucilaginibacter sp.]
MDKTLPKLIVVLLFLLLGRFTGQAQTWKPVGPDDNNEAFSGLIKYNNIVTSPDGVPYVVSSDANNSSKLTVKKFDGSNWIMVGAAGFSGGTTGLISLAINGVTPYVAFSDAANSGKATVMKFDGNSWVTVGAAGFSTGSAGNISISFNGNTPYVAYGGTVQRFDGNNWVMVGATGFSTSASSTVMSFDSNNIPYVAYLDYGTSAAPKATVKKFVGSSWVTVGTPSTLAGQVSFFAFVFYGNIPFVAYTDANNNYKLSVKRFDGSNWVQVGNTNVSTNTAAYISIASNGTPYVAYEDGGLNGKATVKKYNGQSWVTVGVEGFSAGYAENTSIALAGSIPFVTFKNADTKKGTAMLFDGSNWVVAGSTGSISIGAATFTSLAFNNDVPYLAYSDGSNSNKATVKKYDGGNWTTVGAAGFSTGQTLKNSLVFNGGTPYLSYSDNANSSKATVMKFDGSNWVAVGVAGFSSGAAPYISLAFNGTTPYVAYGDYGNSGKVTVKKFDGSSWQTVGAAEFSAGAVNSLAFGINSTVPYVAYADNSNGGKLTVMKFNGTSWVLVGTPNFSAGAYPPLAFDGTTFYAAYNDPNASNKLTVKKFDGSNWVNVGAAGLSASGASYVTFAFNGNTPYVGYADASFGNKMTVKQFDGNNWITVGTPGISAGGISGINSTSLLVNNNKVYLAYDLDGAYVKSFANPASSNAQLSNLALSLGTLAPAFAAGISSYTASVPNTTSSITLTPTLADATASVTVNGVAVASGIASAATPLIVGNNTIATVVTAQDGITTQTYTLTVNRAQAAQTITFAALPAKTYGDADFVPGATASSGLPISYTTSNPAVAIVTANGLIHLVSAGTANITASQVGSTDYLAAPDVVQTLTVGQPQNPGQVLTWKPLGPDDLPGLSAGIANFTNIVTDPSGIPYIAFSDVGNGGKVTVKKFQGSNWVTVGTAGFSAGTANYLSLALNGSIPYVAYRDFSNSQKITVMMFDGSNWTTVGTAGFSDGQITNPTLTFNGNMPYISYAELVNNTKRATVMKFDGTNWATLGTVGFFSSNFDPSLSLAFDGTIPYVVYGDNDYNGKATLKNFNGSSWTTVGTPGFTTGAALYLSLAFNSGTAYVAYADGGNGRKATLKKLNGSNWATVGALGFSTGPANYASLTFSGNTPYIAYQDGDAGKATVKKFDGNSWVTVGTVSFSTGVATYTSLAFSGNIPYLIYRDDGNSSKAIVKKFDGSSWVTVGSGISGGPTGSPSLAFSGITAYIAYSDNNNGGKVTVKKFDGSNWVAVGMEGFTTRYVDQVSLTVSNGTPYIFYGDLGGNFGTGAVMKFDGSNWVIVGASGFKQTTVTYPSIKINNGVPYVVYQTGIVNGGTIVVQKFNGTDWITVGSSIAFNSNYPSLAFNGDTPYVIYSDGPPSANFASQARATVKKFDGTNWVTVGGARFSSDRIVYPSIVFNGNTPYVSYTNYLDGVETIQKFDGIKWVTVSTSGFVSTAPVSFALVGDTPYAAYGSRATVSRFDGSNWITVGQPFVSAGAVNSTSLLVNNNKLYLAYSSDGVYVKYYDLPVSTNAQLSNLALSSGSLTPAFAAGTIAYTASVSNSTTSITLTPTLADATASVKVNGVAVIAGSASAAIPLNIGSNTIKTVVTAQDSTTTQTYTLTVNRAQAAQTITFAAFPTKTYGDADFAPSATSTNNAIAALTYTSSSPAVATIVDGKIHIVGAGTATITANQAADSTHNAATPVSQNFIVVKTVLTITAENKSKTYNEANPELTLTYSGFVNGDTKETALTALPTAATTATATSPAGDYPITATGAAGNNYTFTYLPGTLTIKKASQVITFASIPDKTYGDTDFTLGATASSGLAVAYSSSDPSVASVDANGNVHLLSAGTVTITAQQVGDNNYNAATPVAQTLMVKQASQTITFASLPTNTYYGDADFNLNATSSSGLLFTYASSNTAVATVTTDGKVHVLMAGTTTITASQAGNANFAATNATQNLTVLKAALTIKADDQTRAFGSANPALTITYSGFVNAETQTNLNALPKASTTATSTSAAGTYPIAISGAASDNYAITYIPGTLTVTQAAQTITFGTLAAKAFGNPDFTPAATASSGLPVSFASSNPAVVTIVNGQLHLVAPGTATITATQSGNTNYLAAESVSQTLAIVFSLPAKNFTVSATGESCKNSKNGEINITAASSQNYTATIVVAGTSTAYPFTNQLSVKNLPAGIYPVCITVAGYPDYSQCFNVTVTQPQDLAVSAVINPTSSTLSLSLAGASSYNISLNGATYTTTQSSVSLPLAAGKNSLQVSTSSICQGVYAKTIELPAGIVVYPNPVEQTLSLNIGNNKSVAATAEVYNMQGKMVYRGKTGVNQGNCAFDVPGLLPGNYVLKLVLDHTETRIKIIKK